MLRSYNIILLYIYFLYVPKHQKYQQEKEKYHNNYVICITFISTYLYTVFLYIKAFMNECLFSGLVTLYNSLRLFTNGRTA